MPRDDAPAPMSIYSLLKSEHLEIRAMLWALENSDEDKKSGFEKLKKELISHGRAERQSVYGKVIQVLEDEEMLESEENSHKEIERILDEMSGHKSGSRIWKNTLKELRQAVEYHIDEEEREVFVRMREIFSEKEAKLMSRHYLEAKNKELQVI